MDYLVKKNVIKKNKIIIDIGTKYVKVLFVSFEKGKIFIHHCSKIDVSACYDQPRELVDKIELIIRKRKVPNNAELSISIATELDKIITVKNTKPKDLDKKIRKDYFNKSGNFDWSHMGNKEINGETLQYCLVSSVNKSLIMTLVSDFDKRGFRVTTVSSPIYNLINFADLYSSDFDTKMFIDFGYSTTKIMIENEGVSVYVREIDFGFKTFINSIFNVFKGISIPDIIETLFDESKIPVGFHDESAFFDIVDKLKNDFQNEIIRIIQKCEDDGFTVSKIIFLGKSLPNMFKKIEDSGITVEKFNFTNSQNGSTYTVFSDSCEINESFIGAVGLAINTLL